VILEQVEQGQMVMRLLLVISFLFLPAQAITYSIDKRVPYKKAIANILPKEIFTQVNKNADLTIYYGTEYGGYGWHKDGDAYIGKLAIKSGAQTVAKIAAHEVIHTCGGKHNDNPKSIMFHGDLSQASVSLSDFDICKK
jgi:hypothetical protein